MPSAAPIRPASPISTQQGVETSLRNDLTPFRKACITELDTRYKNEMRNLLTLNFQLF